MRVKFSSVPRAFRALTPLPRRARWAQTVEMLSASEIGAAPPWSDDAATAQRLDTVFEKYAPHCTEIELAAWSKRGRWHKVKDHALYLLNELL